MLHAKVYFTDPFPTQKWLQEQRDKLQDGRVPFATTYWREDYHIKPTKNSKIWTQIHLVNNWATELNTESSEREIVQLANHPKPAT